MRDFLIKAFIGFMCFVFIPALIYVKLFPIEDKPVVATTVESNVEVMDKSVITKTKTKKDGSITTVVVNKDIVTKEQTVTKITPVIIPLPRFSLGAGVVGDISDLGPIKDRYISGGVRTFGNVWLEAEYRIQTKSISLGVRYER